MLNTKEILQLIEIANIVRFDEDIPDYEELASLQIKRKDSSIDFGKAIEMWNEIETTHSKMAKYALNGWDAVLGQELFKKVPIPEDHPNTRYNLGILAMQKIQNFIRLNRIRLNMRLVAFKVRQFNQKHDISQSNAPPVMIPNELLRTWQPIAYSIFNNKQFVPFSISRRNERNKVVGVCEFTPSIFEYFFSSSFDVLLIKTCPKCYRLFLAKPKHRKFCNEKCRSQKNSNNTYKRKNKEKIKNGTL